MDFRDLVYWEGASKEWHQTAIQRAQRVQALEGAVRELLGTTEHYVGGEELQGARTRALEILDQSERKGWKEIAETYMRRINFAMSRVKLSIDDMSELLDGPVTLHDTFRKPAERAKIHLTDSQQVLDGAHDAALEMMEREG